MPAQLRTGTERDWAAIHALLESGGLPTSDLASASPQFVVACEGDAIVAAGALQWFGSTALLRSLVVAEHRRGVGLGRRVVEELERSARASGIAQLVLLTQTARKFFEARDYIAVDRRDVPGDVQMSEQFRSLCPASATCMAKRLV